MFDGLLFQALLDPDLAIEGWINLDRYSHMIDAMCWDARELVAAVIERKTQKKD